VDEHAESQSELARQAALDIEDGKKSRYWKHLQGKIMRWLEMEELRMDLANQKLIKDPMDLEERNDIVKRIALLRQFIKINETILEENLSVIAHMERPIDKILRNANFVGKSTNTNGNGRHN
jgi:hypothetical protein